MTAMRQLASTPERWTVEQYLECERHADGKSEYFDGQIVMMAGGSPDHSLIAANLSGELYQALRGSSCRVYTSDLKVRSSPTQYVYPDLTVICGSVESDDLDPYTATNPRLIVEVLSPSTEHNDRHVKWLRYQNLPSLTDYLLVWQQQPVVEHFSRAPEGQWRYVAYQGVNTELEVASLNCCFPLERIYEGVTLTEL